MRPTLELARTLALAVLVAPGAMADCVCYRVISVQVNCMSDNGTCHHTVNVSGCGGINNQCTYCDDCFSFRFCCDDIICNARATEPCTGAPIGSVTLLPGESHASAWQVYLPACSGGLAPALVSR
jgi:hypothetical protein